MQSLYYLNPKFQASSYLLWLYRLVCVGPGQKPRGPVFSQRGSFGFRCNFTMFGSHNVSLTPSKHHHRNNKNNLNTMMMKQLRDVSITCRSIPATPVVMSDGSLAISSDAMDTQPNPIQLVIIPNAAGKTSLYMVQKKDLNQAFLVKPVQGQEWNVDNASFQSAGISVSIPNSSSNVPKETSAPILSNTMTVNDLLRNVNVAKEGYDMVNLSKTVTVTSSSSTPNYNPLLLPVCDAPSVKTGPVSDLTQARSVTADTTTTGPATANHSTTFTTSNLIRALLRHKMTQQANSGSQQAYPGPQQANPGPRQANIRLRQPSPGLRQLNPGPQQQQQSAGSQVGPKRLIFRLLYLNFYNKLQSVKMQEDSQHSNKPFLHKRLHLHLLAVTVHKQPQGEST